MNNSPSPTPVPKAHSQRHRPLSALFSIALVLHFSATGYYFIGSPPTGFSTGTLGLIFCVIGVLLAGFAAARKE